MTRHLFTAAAAALLASTAFFASIEDAEARGGRGGGGIHRMGGMGKHANMARGANMHRGLAARAKHVGGIQRGKHVNIGKHVNTGKHVNIHKGLHAGNGGRVHGTPKVNKGFGPVHAGNIHVNKGPGFNGQQFGKHQGLNGMNKQAAAESNKLNTPGVRGGQYQQPNRLYAQMGPSTTNTAPQTQPQQNTMPPKSAGPSTTSTGPSTKSTGPQVITTHGGAAIGLAILDAIRNQPPVVVAPPPPPISEARQDLIRRVWNTRFRSDWGQVTPEEVEQIKMETGDSDDVGAWQKFMNQNSGPQQ